MEVNPFNLSLTMDGLSGMKVYQKFIVNNDYLPTNYPKSLEFIITSLNHVVQDNKWITNIESLALPKITTQVTTKIPSLATLPVKPTPLPLNKQNIVNKIIAFAATKGIKDKRILTALLTVAQAESGLNPWKVESFNYSLQRTKEIFPTKLRGLSDSQITYLLKSHAEFANYIYGGLFGNSTNTEFLNGTIHEVIVFNTISDSDRQKIEGYLAWKWGIQTKSTTNLVAGHSFYYLLPQTRNFQPSDILTPLFWWDAADTKTITGTSTVTAWLNKGSWSGSATSYSGTVVSGSKKYNGLNTLVFPTNGELRFTAAIPLQPRAWFAVFNQTSQVTVSGPNFTQYFAIINQTQGSGQDAAAGPLIPLNINTDSYVLSEGPSGNPSGVQTGYLVPNGYNVLKQYGWVNSAVSTASNFQTVNGKDYMTAGTPNANFTATAYRTDSVTYSINTGWYNNSCDCCEIIMFNTEITIQQRQQIEGYLAWKWGLSSSLVTGHPYIKLPPSSPIPFLPTNFTGCKIWLDGVDTAGTGTAPANGASVSSWVDKSGSSNNFTASGTAATYSGIYNAVSFNNSLYTSSYSAAPTTETIFIVFNTSSKDSSVENVQKSLLLISTVLIVSSRSYLKKFWLLILCIINKYVCTFKKISCDYI
mgnify:CR=1 FL=1